MPKLEHLLYSAEDAEFNAFSQHILRVDPTIDLEYLQQKDVTKCQDLQKFCDTHTRNWQHSFQIKKVQWIKLLWILQQSCLSLENFNSHHCLVDPEKTVHLIPTGTCCFQASLERTPIERTNGARNAVLYRECLKPRMCPFHCWEWLHWEGKRKRWLYLWFTICLLIVTFIVLFMFEPSWNVTLSLSLQIAPQISLPLTCYKSGCFNAEREPEFVKSFHSEMLLCSEYHKSKPPVSNFLLLSSIVCVYLCF